MESSTERILTTHVGSLPRPDALYQILDAQDKDQDYDPAKLGHEAAVAVRDIVARQVEAGVDIVSDDEMSKMGYTFYVRRHSLNYLGEVVSAAFRDMQP